MPRSDKHSATPAAEVERDATTDATNGSADRAADLDVGTQRADLPDLDVGTQRADLAALDVGTQRADFAATQATPSMGMRDESTGPVTSARALDPNEALVSVGQTRRLVPRRRPRVHDRRLGSGPVSYTHLTLPTNREV